MAKTIAKIDKFHSTKQGSLAFGLVEILIAYVFISLAIDSGSLWQYGLGIIFFVGGVRNLANTFVLTKNGTKKRK